MFYKGHNTKEVIVILIILTYFPTLPVVIHPRNYSANINHGNLIASKGFTIIPL